MTIEPIRSSAVHPLFDLRMTLLSILLLCFITPFGWAGERNEACPTGLLPAIEDFLAGVNRVTIIDPVEDRGRRLHFYDLAVRNLVREARRFYGPFCPCSEILRDAWEYIENAEQRRTPPPGWDPKAGLQNLINNTDAARRSVMLQLRLTAWGWTICTYQ